MIVVVGLLSVGTLHATADLLQEPRVYLAAGRGLIDLTPELFSFGINVLRGQVGAQVLLGSVGPGQAVPLSS